MLRRFYYNLTSMLPRRYKGQARSELLLEYMQIALLCVFLVFYQISSFNNFDSQRVGNISLWGALALLTGAVWIFANKRNFYVNLHSLILSAFILICACSADFFSSNNLIFLAAFSFLCINILKSRNYAHILALSLVSFAVVSAALGIAEYSSTSRIGVDGNFNYLCQMMGFKRIGGEASMLSVLLGGISFSISAICAKRYSMVFKISALVAFALLWYAMFRCGNLLALFLASAIVVLSPAMYCVRQRKRRTYTIIFMFLCAGTIFAELANRYLGAGLSGIAFPETFDFCANMEGLFSCGFFASSESASGHLSNATALSAFALKYGWGPVAFACAYAVWIIFQALKTFLRLPVEKWIDGTPRFMGEDRIKKFAIKYRYMAHFGTTPEERIFLGSGLCAFASAVIISIFEGGLEGMYAPLFYSGIFAFVVVGIGGKIRFEGRIRPLKNVVALFLLLSALKIFSVFDYGTVLSSFKFVRDYSPPALKKSLD